MTKPPPQIDGADVIAYAILDPAIHKDMGTLRLYADGALQTCFYGLAIATYDLTSVYLFFCDTNWETENDTFHNSVADAINTAKRQYGMLPDHWSFYLDELRPI
ncbi:MAG: hypothetical protein R3C18_09450 [Planctomycetaceae bacterium]